MPEQQIAATNPNAPFLLSIASFFLLDPRQQESNCYELMSSPARLMKLRLRQIPFNADVCKSITKVRGPFEVTLYRGVHAQDGASGDDGTGAYECLSQARGLRVQVCAEEGTARC